MTPELWNEIRPIFAKAIRMRTSQRDTYLKKACRNSMIRRRVDSLLSRYDSSQNILGIYSSVGGTLLSRYKVGEPIGQGGMGLIHRGFDNRLKRGVALKVLHAWSAGHTSSRRRLIKEAQYASALNHPNIVTIHDIAQDKGVFFIVMECLTGKSLDAVIPTAGFPIRTALHYAVQIADALAAAETADILHGDLKPMNVMITEKEHVKLLDFGLARAFATKRGRSKGTLRQGRFGTKEYMAPELLVDFEHEPDPRSEIFSFGLLLQEMLTGKHAFSRAGRKDLLRAILTERPRALPRKVPEMLARVVRRCLEKEPALRFQAIRDLLDALQKCGEGTNGRAKASMRQRVGRSRLMSAEIRQVQATLERIGYENIARSRQALADLAGLMQKSPSAMAKGAVTSALKDLILTVGDFGDAPVPMRVREVRKFALDVMKTSTQGHLGRCFKEHELEHLDLYAMNFAGERLPGLSFYGSFLVEASFAACDLARASFVGAYVRNVDFAQADLSDADLTDADWFNALHLTESQLRSVRQDTLLKCPANVDAMHRYLKARYGLSFESWSARVQEELRATWQDYLRPGGLRDFVLQ